MYPMLWGEGGRAEYLKYSKCDNYKTDFIFYVHIFLCVTNTSIKYQMITTPFYAY